MQNDEEIPTLDQVVGRNLYRVRQAAGLSADRVAWLARQVGLNWSRSAVAAAEKGTKTIDAAELVLLTLVPISGMNMAELLDGTGRVRVGGVSPELELVRRLLGGEDAGPIMLGPLGLEHAFGPITDRFFQEQKKAIRITRARWRRLAPSVNFDTLPAMVLLAVEQNARGEAEQSAARRLQVDPMDLAIAAYGAWGRSLTEERDARFAERIAGSPAPSTHSKAAMQGRITLKLVEELAPVLAKPKHRGSAAKPPGKGS